MTHHAIRSLFVLFGLLATASLTGCSNENPNAGAYDPTDPASYTQGQSYTVRGEVLQLPDAGPPPRDLKLQHEHIPDFVGKTGEVHMNPDGVPGMKAMAMPFPNVAPGALDGVSVGDKIEFLFLVRWDEDAAGNRTPSTLVAEITPLPPETVISNENKPTP